MKTYALRPTDDGWAPATTHGNGKAHLFRNGRSLCGRYDSALWRPERPLNYDLDDICKRCLDRSPW